MEGSQFSLHWGFTKLLFFFLSPQKGCGISKRCFVSVLRVLAQFGLHQGEGSIANSTLQEADGVSELYAGGKEVFLQTPCHQLGACNMVPRDREGGRQSRGQKPLAFCSHKIKKQGRMVPSSQCAVAKDEQPISAPSRPAQAEPAPACAPSALI